MTDDADYEQSAYDKEVNETSVNVIIFAFAFVFGIGLMAFVSIAELIALAFMN